MAARPPEKCLDHSSLRKARDTVTTELLAFRSRFGRVAIVEQLYAQQLARYDERERELHARYRPATSKPTDGHS